MDVGGGGVAIEHDDSNGEGVAALLSRRRVFTQVTEHPDLAGRLALEGTLTADSTSEQGRLGFTSMSREEFDKVAGINRRYREKHGFPVIVALALHQTRDTAIAEMERRIGSTTDAEIEASLEQIGHISRNRLKQRMAALE